MASPNEGAEVEQSTGAEPLFQSGAPEGNMDDGVETKPRELICTRCGQTVRVGELVCPNCGLAMVSSGETHRIDDAGNVVPTGPQQTGEAIVNEEKPIVFEVDGKVLNLTIKETLIVGRRAAGEQAPDVDLSPFGAEEHGVSRRHLQLKRRGSLIYVTDLHSTNHTYLNGRRLIPEGDRLLRSGDEIRLGRLRIRVRF
ncbi:MAG: FHA domain-containing protein [Anaerolineae bacterium]|nr:FHA domain-containing protein [Anaerolineae bacterium]